MTNKAILSRPGLLFVTVAFALTAALATAQAQDFEPQSTEAYLINPGDILVITVWKEPDLSRQVVIRPDGAFSYPLAGDIRTNGRSTIDIEKIIKEKLQRYLPDPVVTVAVIEIAGHAVYVIGQVLRPGKFVLPTVTDVTQALSLAGGTTPFAKLDKIKILRRVEGRLMAIPFDYGDIEKGKRLHQNIILEPGDVVIVP